MDWPDEIASVVKKASLSGLLSLSNFILTPNDKALRTHEINLKAHEASDFQLHRSGGNEEEGDPPKTELRFIVRTGDVEAPARLATYFQQIGGECAALKLDYAQQDKLDLRASNEDEKEEEPAEEKASGPILASAREVNGTSRPGINKQRNRRGGAELVDEETGEVLLTGEAAEAHAAARRGAAN
jgi:hypothetical protein